MLNPPFKGRFSRSARSPAVAPSGTIYYPLWLAYATGVLEEAGFNVRLIDAPAHGLNLKEVIASLNNFSPRMIVLDSSTPSIFSDVKSAETLKDVFPQSLVVLVGTHVSALPEETLRMSKKIDAVARREYDYTLRDLALALNEQRSLHSVKGLSFRAKDEYIHNDNRPFIEDLDALPFISKVYKKHLFIEDYYFAAANFPMVMTITGRGCPNRCYFCVYPQTFHSRKYRIRSPENIVDEFEWILDNIPGVKEIGIEDDTFTADSLRTRQICELIIERNIRVKWYCNVRSDLDYETLRVMKKAGCRLVTTGFESGNQKVLDNMQKNLKLEQIEHFVANAKKVKILVHGCLVLGNPGETKEMIQESLEFVKKLNCDSMQFYPLFVYPGTEAYERVTKAGYLKTTDYSQWVSESGQHSSVINLPDLSAEELVQICKAALKSYHFRPAYIGMKLKQAVLHPSEGRRTARSALHYIRSLTAQDNT